MKFNKNILDDYLNESPAALVIERWFECEILKEQEFKRPILDIGCGEGLFAKILFDEKIDTGIDPNGKELKKAQEYGQYNELIQCYGNEIPKEDASYSTIFSNSVLEHIPDLNPVLKEAHRLLSNDGMMYVTIPTDKFDKYNVINQLLLSLGLKKLSVKYSKFFNNFWAHFHFYNQDGWTKLFEENGFQVVECRQYASKKICVTNDFLAHFAIFSFIVKKITNRWFLSSKLRKIFVIVFKPIVRMIINGEKNKIESGGLIFYKLKKV